LRDSRAAGEPFDQFVRRRKVRETVVGGGIYYRGYLTKDGALAVGCLSPTTRGKMNHALGIDGETDTRNTQSVTADLIARVEKMLTEKTTDEWMEIFDRNGVPASPVWFVEELQDNPQVIANDYVVELEHDLTGPQKMSASPFKMSDSPPMVQGAAPPLGRDTLKWMRELGYSPDEVEALAAAGAIGLGL
ncbi:MAG TPA: CoA transferase, partial [Tepidiformaceae bacterium]